MKLPKVRGELLFNVSLAKYSWFQVGGNAEVLFKPTDLKDLQDFLKNIDKTIPITIIGGGSNLLIRDGGVNGVVIIIKDMFSNIEFNNDAIKAECGILNSKLLNFAKKNEITGYEFLGAIPGTLGGAIRGNAGCYGSEIKDMLVSVDVVDLSGNLKTYTVKDCNFEYRKNNLPEDLIFISAVLKADNKKSKNDIENIYNDMMQKRMASQPHGVKTCGSTFKNPTEKPAWKIIQELGYQNKEIHGAKMSEKHANFMVNTGTATATSLEDLGEMIRHDAREKQGIELEWEIRRIGNKVN